jgi:hypothetical protein
MAASSETEGAADGQEETERKKARPADGTENETAPPAAASVVAVEPVLPLERPKTSVDFEAAFDTFKFQAVDEAGAPAATAADSDGDVTMSGPSGAIQTPSPGSGTDTEIQPLEVDTKPTATSNGGAGSNSLSSSLSSRSGSGAVVGSSKLRDLLSGKMPSKASPAPSPSHGASASSASSEPMTSGLDTPINPIIISGRLQFEMLLIASQFSSSLRQRGPHHLRLGSAHPWASPFSACPHWSNGYVSIMRI